MPLPPTTFRRQALGLVLLLALVLASVGSNFFAAEDQPGPQEGTVELATAGQTSANKIPGGKIDFNRQIKPILSQHCFHCHGPDPAERQGGSEGGLRLDTRDGAMADLGDYAAIVPHKSAASDVIKRVTTRDPDLRMPPADSSKSLTDAEIELLRAWIDQGAEYSQHWSYVPPVRHEPPAVKNSAWSRSTIDRFLLARTEKQGLAPSAEADRHTLIRRVSLDLTGLPPTPEEVSQFIQDTDPQAYEKLVDRLLAKPTYGEHFGQMWLDLSRYADSSGYADDPPRKIWLFRDYVIRALNANMPLRQMTVEMIAGDLLPNRTEDQLVATAFHRNTMTNSEGGTDNEEFRNVAVVDRVNTTMAVWMGTTMACAQCHTHKYDPLTQEEYFKLFAFFNNTADADLPSDEPLASIYSEDEKTRRTKLQEELTTIEKRLRTSSEKTVAEQQAWEASQAWNAQWQSPRPRLVSTKAGAATVTRPDNTVLVNSKESKDTYNVELPLPAGKLHAIRLDALTDDSLPGKGPGHSNGNFLINEISARLISQDDRQPTARFVRIELPGKEKQLMLAEVEVFSNGQNVGTLGTASQSSTDGAAGSAGEPTAARANDGDTNGHFTEGKSVASTSVSENPWWELDLKSVYTIDRLVVWNRADSGSEKLADFNVILLDAKRKPVWQETVKKAPKLNIELKPQIGKPLKFTQALADYSKEGYSPDKLIDGSKAEREGWSIDGQQGRPHSLSLIVEPIEVAAGSRVILVLDQHSPHEKHTLGKFRVSASQDQRALQWAKTPPAVLTALGKPPKQRNEAELRSIEQHFLTLAPSLQADRDRVTALRKQFDEIKPVTVLVMEELKADKRRATKIQHRGNFLDLGETVHEGTPAIFPPLPKGAPLNRLTLAKWLVSPENPLTARVIANRYWERIFGIGIVSTSEEFGSQGEQPVHPELLDWLATELVRLDWDMKAFARLLVTSAAYRQSSVVAVDKLQADPDNRMLSRGPRVRLSAEMVRDQALAVSGLLSPKMYGPSVKPPQPSLGLTAAFGGSTDWETSQGEDKFRRALYTTLRRSNPYPSMAVFDTPNREVCTVRRNSTNTPLQALVTLNDPVYVEAAQSLSRLIVSSAKTPD
ncbi:MAG: DUF1553 domain-containing protein, partial [Planctomycetota bacterium]|nr:DUF1553 domain-containing protein [Planctomycetota bacterium]